MWYKEEKCNFFESFSSKHLVGTDILYTFALRFTKQAIWQVT